MTAENSGRLTLEGRKKLTLTGAKEVLRFDEELAELDTGTVVVEGQVQSFSYGQPRRRGRWRS